MGVTKRRYTVSIPPELNEELKEIRKLYFQDVSQSTMLKILVQKGLHTINTAAESDGGTEE